MYNTISRQRDGHISPEKLNEAIGCNYLIEVHKDVYRYLIEVDSTNDAIQALAKFANDDEELHSEGSLEKDNFTFDFHRVEEVVE